MAGSEAVIEVRQLSALAEFSEALDLQQRIWGFADSELLPLRFPGAPPTADDLAEERRLFFVGLTRAQDRLFVSHARRRRWRGTEREMSPSRFFESIDPRLFELRGDQGARRPRDQQLRLL